MQLVINILKTIEAGNNPKAEDLGVSVLELANTLETLQTENKISGVKVARGTSDRITPVIFYHNPKLTTHGMEFLESHL